MKISIRFNLIALVLALSALVGIVSTASGGTPAAHHSRRRSPDRPACATSSARCSGSTRNLQTPSSTVRSSTPSASTPSPTRTSSWSTSKSARRSLTEWEHKYDKTGMLDTNEGVDIACSQALYSLDQRFDGYLNVNNTAAEKKMIDPTIVGIGVAVAIKSTIPPAMLEDIVAKAHPSTQPAGTNTPATNPVPPTRQRRMDRRRNLVLRQRRRRTRVPPTRRQPMDRRRSQLPSRLMR